MVKRLCLGLCSNRPQLGNVVLNTTNSCLYFVRLKVLHQMYYKFVNAFARMLKRTTHTLKDVKVICDNELKTVKTNQAAVQQVIDANEFHPVSVAAPNNSSTQPPQQDVGIFARDVMLSTTPLVAQFFLNLWKIIKSCITCLKYLTARTLTLIGLC